MPELPEVEVLKRSLSPHLIGESFRSIDVLNAALREPASVRSLRRHLKGREVTRLRRRSKYLLVDVEGGSTLVVHLGMSGRLTLSPEGPPEPHEHVRFGLESGPVLRFRDPRRFGLVFALPTASLEADRHFAHLGLEPLEGLDGDELWRLSRGRKAPVKAFLMDARHVVGVGNIYASEALFRAGVHPKRAAGRISRERWNLLAEAVVAVLNQAVAEGGTTLNDFADGDGTPGYFQVSLAVYGREGGPCASCSESVRRIVQSNRSTFYCPGCQR
ncbi:MAG: bifunctional DNA-formamidopyrimidine glycosylase/DNA-(apurinic or apyrimidinic site) lyase [Acidobacteriota bacterium]